MLFDLALRTLSTSRSRISLPSNLVRPHANHANTAVLRQLPRLNKACGQFSTCIPSANHRHHPAYPASFALRTCCRSYSATNHWHAANTAVPQPPPFSETYGQLAALRLPFHPFELDTSNARSVNTAAYTGKKDIYTPAGKAPTFKYADDGVVKELESRFESLVDLLGIRSSPKCHVLWEETCQRILYDDHRSEAWAARVGQDLLELVVQLLEDALEHSDAARWPKWGFHSPLNQPLLTYAQQGDTWCGIRHCNVTHSAVSVEYKSIRVLRKHIVDMLYTSDLQAGRLRNGSAIAKKIGLQQIALSERLKSVDARYGVIFTGGSMVLTSTGDEDSPGPQVVASRSAHVTDARHLLSGLLAMMAPPTILPFDPVPDPRAIDSVWMFLKHLLKLL
ncbi:hypothetical protein GGX14DRAFT_558321 [Mycena pura]|uniref:Uncharacterized protein n=1 Tax=Mycena pura TaxID=153505 RepID=A0AAD6VVG3_9AGAR|nr:hypothetical protein GGX14DRAFT_558321 [Mycena pura]